MKIGALATAVSAAILALGLAACGAPQRALHITSVPEGTYLIEEGTGLTYQAPVTLRYDLDEQFMDANGCLHVRNFQAVWASGVGLNPPPTPLVLCSEHEVWTMVVRRPNVPAGLVEDQAAAQSRLHQIEMARIDAEFRHLQGEAALGQGIQTLTHGLVCAGGGCSRPTRGSDDINVAPSPYPSRQIDQKPLSGSPPWAQKRGLMDHGFVCHTDIWGRNHCGSRQ